jgi:hypothetical protein
MYSGLVLWNSLGFITKCTPFTTSSRISNLASDFSKVNRPRVFFLAYSCLPLASLLCLVTYLVCMLMFNWCVLLKTILPASFLRSSICTSSLTNKIYSEPSSCKASKRPMMVRPTMRYVMSPDGVHPKNNNGSAHCCCYCQRVAEGSSVGMITYVSIIYQSRNQIPR